MQDHIEWEISRLFGLLDVREGAQHEHDPLPWRLMNEPAKSGPRKGAMNSRKEMDTMLAEYHRLHWRNQ
ncbi:MAG: hypothetical protein M1305_02675 [Candidatus Marsarchaeota archaeon]|nr:hypothetical protein [Candidatus Marsarchaeota archaeon]